MKGSLRIASVKGIGVYIHWSFLVLPLLVVFNHLSGDADFFQILIEIILLLAVFFCVVLHEFGHALTAARFGIRTRDIILLPVGGVARLEKLPEKPIQEFWVAIAGPIVNVVIVFILGLIMLIGNRFPIGLDLSQLSANGFLEYLAVVNIYLILFNLIPAFPMDGGRILRALLAIRMGKEKATRIAAVLGQFIALLFIIVGFFQNPFLVLIGVFVFFGARQEAEQVQQHRLLDRILTSDLMITRWNMIDPAEPLSKAAKLLLEGHETEFLVGDGSHVQGVLDRDSILRGLMDGGEQALAERYCKPCSLRLNANDPVEAAWEQMTALGLSALPVYANGEIAGVLTRENIREYLLLSIAGERYTALASVKADSGIGKGLDSPHA